MLTGEYFLISHATVLRGKKTQFLSFTHLPFNKKVMDYILLMLEKGITFSSVCHFCANGYKIK